MTRFWWTAGISDAIQNVLHPAAENLREMGVSQEAINLVVDLFEVTYTRGWNDHEELGNKADPTEGHAIQ